MKYIILLLLLAAGCHSPKYSDSTNKFPKAVYSETYEPVYDIFNYDPEKAVELYDLPSDFKFYNLDPTKFDGLSLDFLGNVNVMTTFEWTLPAIDYAAITAFSEPNDTLRNGELPSPYEYQNSAILTLGQHTTTRNIPLGISLAKVKGTENQVIAVNCLACHSSIVGHSLVAGAYNVNRNPRYVETYLNYQNLEVFKIPLLYLESIIKRESLGVISENIIDSNIRESMNNMLTSIHRKAQSNTDGLPTVVSNDSITSGIFPMYFNQSVNKWQYSSKLIDKINHKLKAFKRIPVSQPHAWWLARYIGHNHTKLSSKFQDTTSFINLWTAFFSVPPFNRHHEMSWDERRAKMASFESYMQDIQSPDYPHEINQELASIGKDLYTRNCAGCHGRFIETDGGYILNFNVKKASIEYDKILTDPMSNLVKSAILDPIFEELNKLPEFKGHEVSLNPYYELAPPLVGVWATAPYLHNNSVPTIYQVLNSSARSEIWYKDPNVLAYDYIDVGVKAKSVKYSNVNDPLFYDTTQPYLGMSNRGHYFGDKLSDFERYAIIEFLKTLSTKNVIPNPIKE